MRKYFVFLLCLMQTLLPCMGESQASSSITQASPIDLTDVTAPPGTSGPTRFKFDHHPVVALALGGGGTRGAAHIGVLRVLDREKIPIDMIVGTSMGAIIGGFYSAGMAPDRIQERIEDKHFFDSFNTVPIPVRILLIPVLLVPRLFGHHSYDGLYRGRKFARYLNKSVPEQDRDIAALKPRFACVGTNLLDSRSYTITSGNLGQALRASSAIPFLRKPVLIDDRLLVDGGIVANLPVKQAKELGADIVIAVDVDESFEVPLPADHFRKIGSVAPRVISLILAKTDEDQLRAADVIIHPDVTGIALLDHKTEVGLRAVSAGEKAAEAALPAIRSKLGSAPQK